jgi:hypothetical protein
MRVTSEEIEKQALGTKDSEQRPVALTLRDRELFVHLAIARYLTLEQISKLVFPGKNDSIARRRLSRLVAGKYPYVRRLPFRTKAEGSAVAWSLKPLGYMAAQNFFEGTPDQPSHDPPGAEFLEHDVLLNETYMALAVAAKRKKLSFDRWPFRWLPSDSARLPWTEYDREASSPASRLICPDATLELLQVKRRVFIELETGTHTLGFQREGAPGRNATKAKIERYTRFVMTPTTGLGNDTAYLQTFPDGWPAELLFVVPTRVRRDAIAEFVASSWRPMNESVQFSIRALTFEQAPAELCRAARLSPETGSTPRDSAAPAAVTPEEVRAFYDFYNGAIAAIAAVRQFAKHNPQLAAMMQVPQYPANHDIVKQLCIRLGGVAR